MPKLAGDQETIEFEVYCAKCGNGLCGNTKVDYSFGYRRGVSLQIDPCEKCLESAKSDGYDEGYEEGQTAAEEEI